MLKGFRCLDRYTRDLLHSSGPDSCKRPPYSTLGSTGAPYDWIYRGSGATIMPPLVKPHDTTTIATAAAAPPSTNTTTTTFLMAPEEEEEEDGVKTKLKCVLVGDGSVGKTSLVVSYTTNGYPTEYVPTAFDNYNVVVNVDNQPIRLQLCDTAGQDDFDSLRPLCYPQTDVFIVAFSVVSPTSFHNVREKWLPELRRHNPAPPILLVGTQSDLRTDVKVLIELAQYREQPVSEVSARRLAQQVGAIGYVESSALTQRNLKEVFDQAILAALEARSMPGFSRAGSSKRSFSRLRKPKDSGGSGGILGDSASQPLTHHTSTSHRHNHHSHHHHNNNNNQYHHHSEETSRKRGWRKLCCFS